MTGMEPNEAKLTEEVDGRDEDCVEDSEVDVCFVPDASDGDRGDHDNHKGKDPV